MRRRREGICREDPPEMIRGARQAMNALYAMLEEEERKERGA